MAEGKVGQVCELCGVGGLSSRIGLTTCGPMVCKECFKYRHEIKELIVLGFRSKYPTLPAHAPAEARGETTKPRIYTAEERPWSAGPVMREVRRKHDAEHGALSAPSLGAAGPEEEPEVVAPEPSCTLCGAGMILVYKCRSCGATSDLNEIPSDLRDANRRLAKSLEKAQAELSRLRKG